MLFIGIMRSNHIQVIFVLYVWILLVVTNIHHARCQRRRPSAAASVEPTSNTGKRSFDDDDEEDLVVKYDRRSIEGTFSGLIFHYIAVRVSILIR